MLQIKGQAALCCRSSPLPFSGAAGGESITAIEELIKPPVAESKSLLSSGDPSREVFAYMQNSSHGSRRKVGHLKERREHLGLFNGCLHGRHVGL